MRLLLCPMVLLGFISTSIAEEAKRANALPVTAAEILAKAEKIELYALDPSDTKKSDDPRFRGWKITKQVNITKADNRTSLVKAVNQGLDNQRDTGAKCFEPRHAIRAKVDGKQVDLLICYECFWLYAYVGEKDQDGTRLITTTTARAALDALLK